jgi:capsular exopolysaccharide synthesis family protein
MELRQYLRAVRGRWRFVAVSVVVCTAVAAALAWTKTPTYSATTQLFVSANGAPGDTGATYQAGLFSQERVLSYVKMVANPDVLDAVIDQLDLRESTRDLSGKIDASVPTGTVLLNVTARDQSAKQAAAISQAVADQFISFVSRLEQSGPGASRVAVSVTSPAQIPTSPTSPRKPLYLGLGILFGLVIGVGGALVWEALDRRIRSEEEAVIASGAPVLATVAESGGTKDSRLVMATKPASSRAEAFRRLRANLTGAIEEGGARSIVVSSAKAEAGKSAVTANLALSFAETGRRVVVVDADLRESELTDALGHSSSPGLTDVVRDELPLASALRGWTENASLAVLGRGAKTPDPSRILASRRFATLVRELADRFDLVVIDAPPLLEFSDAVVVAHATAGAVVVARSGSTRTSDLSATVDSLQAVDVRTLGIVLNRGGRRLRGRGSTEAAGGPSSAHDRSPVAGERVSVP